MILIVNKKENCSSLIFYPTFLSFDSTIPNSWAVFNTIDLGAELDIKKACQLTRYYIEKLAIKGFSFIYDSNPYAEKQPIKRNEAITDKVSETLEDLYKEAVDLLSSHRVLLEDISRALIDKEVLIWAYFMILKD